MRQLEVKETMEKNELLMTYGTDYKEMTKRLLEEADLIGRIPGNDSLIGISPIWYPVRMPPGEPRPTQKWWQEFWNIYRKKAAKGW